MNSKTLLTGIVILAALCASGCAKRESMVAHFHGTAHQLAIYNQLAEPDAEVSTQPVEGLNGKAVIHNHNRYIKSFEEPKKPQESKYTIK